MADQYLSDADVFGTSGGSTTMSDADVFGSSSKDVQSNDDVFGRQDTSYVAKATNVARGIGERAGDLAGGFMRTLGNLPSPDDYIAGLVYGEKKPDNLPSQADVTATANELAGKLESIDLGYKQMTSWDDFKKSPLRNFIPFAIEQGIVSAPDMVGAVGALPAYVAARTGELGQQRAKNNGLENATVDDLLKTLPAATVSAMLDRFGARGMFGLDEVAVQSLKQLPKEIAKAGLKEGATEAAQEGVEYTGTNLGTKEGFDPKQVGEQMAAAAVAGAGFGGLTRAASSGTEVATGKGEGAHTEGANVDEQVPSVPQDAAPADVLYGADPEAAPAAVAEPIQETAPIVDKPKVAEPGLVVPPPTADRERLDSPRLTTEDRASPLPNDLIDDGKALMESATGQSSSDVSEQTPALAADPMRAQPEEFTNADVFAPTAETAPLAAEESNVDVGLATSDGAAPAAAAAVVAPIDTAKSSIAIPRRDVGPDTAVTAAGREVPVKYAVVEASSLIPSQRDEGGANAAYPAELQPRDRSRIVSDAQVSSISQNINPRLLDKSPRASDGAPIISEDGVVESGNGRALALRRAYSQGNAEGYRQYLAEQGYPVDGMSQPVLVRVREGQMASADRQAFTREANERDTLAMSATEQAMADAAALPDSVLSLYRGGDIDQSANRDFVKGYLQRVVNVNDQARMVGADGSLSQEAIRRVQAGLLGKAYGDSDLVGSLVESPDNNIKAIGGALTDVAAEWAQMRAEAASGSISRDVDQSAALLEAVRLVERARKEGQKVADLVAQRDIFSGQTVSPEAEAFLRLMFRNNISFTQPTGREKISDALRFYVGEARKTQDGTDLLGEAAPKPEKIIETARAKQNGPEQRQQDLLTVAQRDAGVRESVRPSGGKRAVEDERGRSSEGRAESARGSDQPAGKATAESVKPPSIEGSKIDGEWSRFAKSSGTLDIPRAEMPQIKAEHRGAMVNFLNARDISHKEETIAAADLKPTQAEFSRKKVAAAKEFEGGDRSILVSKDGHILDGHHQWLAKREAGEDIKAIRIDAPIRKLLDTVKEFPSATQDGPAAPRSLKEKIDQKRLDAAGNDTRSESFKRWFGDSKAVDAKGEPLTVYRGEGQTFAKIGLWFTTDRDAANAYSEALAGGYEAGANVTPAYVSLKNPLEIDAKGARYDAIPFEGKQVSSDDLARIAEDRGHDGLILRSVKDGSSKAVDVFAVQSRTQIKSKFNRGTFDPQDERIMFSKKNAKSEDGTYRVRDTAGGVDTEFAFSDKFRDQAEAVTNDLREKLNSLGLKDIGLRVADSITAIVNGERFAADGRFLNKVIDIALDAKDPASVLNHEAIHALRKLDVFSKNEWSILSHRSAKEWMGKYNIAENYRGFPEWAQVEEGIAHAYADWANGKATAGIVAKAFRRIQSFIGAMSNVLKGKGFKSVDSIFNQIASGEAGARPRDNFGRFQTAQDTMFKSPADAPGDAKFALAHAPDTAEESEQVLQGFIARGQPIERAIRLPFQILGGIDKYGQWNPGKYVTERLGRAGMMGASMGGVIGTGIGTFVGGPIGAPVGGAIGATAGTILLRAKFDPKGRFGWVSSIAENARRGLVDRYGLSDEYIEADRQRAQGKRAILQQAQDVMQVLSSAHVGTSEAKVLQSILTGEDVRDADMALVAAPIRKAIDELGTEAVSLGLISAESFERNRGSYLHRVYQKNEIDQGGLASWVSNFMAKKRTRIIGDSMKGRGIFWDVAPERLARDIPALVDGGKPQISNGDKFKVLDYVPGSTKDLVTGEEKAAAATRRVYLPADKPIPSQYKGEGWTDRGEWEVRGKGKNVTLWRDYTKEERGKMGEILDARYTIAKTFMLMANDLSTGRFYRDVAENEEWAQSAEPATAWRDASEYNRFWNDPEIGWVKVPDSTLSATGGKKRYGALAGKFVRAEIWRDLAEVEATSKSGVWKTLLNQWKVNKTARSPVTHMNNIMSNLMFMDMADVRAQDLVSGIKAFASGSAEYIEARDAGAFGSDMISQELRKTVLQPILDEIAASEQGGVENSFLARAGAVGKVADKIWSWAKTADAKMLDAYSMEDEVFRMATYIRRRSLGDSVESAAQNAREQFLDYDIRAPWVNAARSTVLPFVSYTYRAVPKIAENIANRPWKIAKYFAIAYAVNALAYMWDDGDDGEERERASLRDEEQGWTWLGIPRMVRMPYRDADGMPVFFDVRRWIPSGDVFDTEQGQSALPLPAPLQLGGPLLLAFEFALNKQSFTGQEITNELTDSSADKAAKVSDWLWKTWMPSAAYVPNSWYWTKVANALKGAEDSTGRKYSLREAAASSIGIKLKPQNVDDGLQWHYRDIEDVDKALKTEARRLARNRDRNLVSQDEFNRSMALLLEKQANLSKKADELSNRSQPKGKSP